MSVFHGDIGDPYKQPTPLWQKVVLVVFLLVAVVFLLRSVKDSGGLLSTNNCTTHKDYPVPKDAFKGVGAMLAADRCSGSLDEAGRAKPYVQVSVVVKGQTNDKSKVKDLKATIRLFRRPRSGKGWQRVPPKDTLEKGVQKNGSNVVYQTQQSWAIQHVPVQARVALVLTTSKGRPVRVDHTFSLP